MIGKKLQKGLERLGLPSGDLAGPSFGVALINGVGIALQFVAAYLLARLLGASGYGVFAYAFSWTQLIASIALLGFDKLLVREVSKAQSGGDRAWIRPFLARNGLRSSVILILIAAFGYSASFLPFGPFEDPEVRFAYRWSMFAVPFLGLITLQRSVLQGLNAVVRGQFVEKAIRPTGLIIGTLLLYGVLRGLGVREVVIVNLIAFVLASLVGLYFILRSTSPATKAEEPSGPEGGVLKRMSGTFLVIGWLQILAGKWDILILGSMGDNEGTGVLQIVIRLSIFLHFFLNALNAALAPKLAEWHRAGMKERMQRSLTRGVRGINLITLPIALVILIFPGPILGIFGASFVEGRDALLIFAATRIFGLLLGPTGYILMMTGQQRKMMQILLVGNGLHLLLALLLIPQYGVMGAAIAFASSSLLERSWMFLSVRRKLGIDPSVFGISRT